MGRVSWTSFDPRLPIGAYHRARMGRAATDPYCLKIVPMRDTASASRAMSQVAALTVARPVLASGQAAASLAMSLTQDRAPATLTP
jgi:hypothetical protein